MRQQLMTQRTPASKNDFNYNLLFKLIPKAKRQ